MLYAAAAALIVYILVTGPPYVVVSSYSMFPTLFPGDLVVVNKWVGQVEVGDVVVYRVPEGARPPFKPGSLVIHRVVAIRGDQIITKGDNNPVPDQPRWVPRLTLDDVYGVAVVAIPYIGWPSLAVQGAYHVLVLAVLIGAFLYAWARVARD